jgi:regulator of sigma E protease
MSVVIFILILAVLIIVHEYGHFIVAKKWGIRVDEFGIGYPPRVKTLFKRKGTIFTLNWIPFGGFVKIFGENPEDVKDDEPSKGVALTSKSKFAQATVMFAGPLFNFIFAWFVILIALFLGFPSSVDSTNEKYIESKSVIVTNVMENSPAEEYDVLIGDRILSAYYKGTYYDSIQNVPMSGGSGDFVTLDLLREKEVVKTEVLIGDYIVGDKPGIGVGISEVGIYKPPFFRAVLDSFVLTGTMIYQIVVGLGNLIIDAFRGTADISNLTGPVGIVSLVGDASALGIVYLLTFVALISINLGVINLIPFPALDGGRILFLVIEKIKGSRISPKVSNTLNSIGFLLLIALMIFITFRDILKLF